MITYYPWSEKVFEECLLAYDRGELSTLDLELTAKCTQASCIYCDSRPNVGSRHPNELNYRDMEKLLKDAKKLGLQWIYACGLGEPLEDFRFERIIEIASSLGIRISIFTNGISINEKMAKWLHDNKVCIILKVDTFDEVTFDKILGKKGTAHQIYQTINFLLDAGYGKNCGNHYTDLAFSIVPTTLNVGDIKDVIKFAKANNIFPLIGELERAGRASEKRIYDDFALDEEKTLILKKKVDELLWKRYILPICPTIITGVHIDNIGNCVVDSETGLNCKWFLLKEPKVKILGNVYRDDLKTLFELVRKYRKKCFTTNSDGIERSIESITCVFGGCGGCPQKIFQLASDHL